MEFNWAVESAARVESERNKIPLIIVRAIIQTESNGNMYAYRVEPRYRYLVNVLDLSPFRSLTPEEIRSEIAPHDFPYYPAISSRDTEWWGQQASWGPMQVMGAVAREYGFMGAFPELCSSLGIHYGVIHLAHLAKRHLERYGWAGVVNAYNTGTPFVRVGGHQYIDKVSNYGGFQWDDFTGVGRGSQQ